MDMPTILVGKFELTDEKDKAMLEERYELIRILEKNRIPVIAVNSMWPRDDFVFHENVINFRRAQGHYADGGYVRSYPEFTIACAGVSKKEDSRMPEDDPETRYAKLSRLYKNPIQIFPDPDYSLNQELRPHSDMILLPIPQRKVLFVDTAYYHKHGALIEKFANSQKLNLRTIDNDYRNPSWPCNTLIVPDGKGLVAITNSTDNGQFICDLQDLDIKVISVPFYNNCRAGGSVNCATNIIPEGRYREVSPLFDNQKGFLF